MDPKEPCVCGHEREWHDSCSRCHCPFFIGSDAPKPIARAWKRAMKDRARREGPLDG